MSSVKMACLHAGSCFHLHQHSPHRETNNNRQRYDGDHLKWKCSQTFPSRKLSFYISFLSYWVEGKVCPTKPRRWWLQPDMLIYYETQERTSLLLISLTKSSFHNNLHSTPHRDQLAFNYQSSTTLFCWVDNSQLTWSMHWGLECPHIPQHAPSCVLLQHLHLPHQGSQESSASAIIKTFSTISRCFARNIYANFGNCNLVLFFTSSVLPCKLIPFSAFHLFVFLEFWNF